MPDMLNLELMRIMPDMTIIITKNTMSSTDLIIEYSGNPSNKGIIKDANIRYRESNRICADVVEV